MEDSQILTLFWNRDQEAIAQSQKKFGSYLHAIAGSILYDPLDAEECVSDTYLSAWNRIPPEKPNPLSVFLGSITRQLSIDRYRKNNAAKRKPDQYVLSLSELEDTFPGGATPEELAEGKALAQTISDFLRTQSQADRVLFLRRYYFFDSLKDSAAFCGISQSKAKTRLYRTRQALKAYLLREGFML